jgi:hypothetical protein
VDDLPNITPTPKWPWDQQPDEAPGEFLAFEAWLEGPALVDRAFADRAGQDLRYLRTLALTRRWVERRHAWEHALGSMQRQALAQFVQGQTSELQTAWRKAYDLCIRSLHHMEATGEVLTQKNAIAGLTHVTEALRLLKGEPTAQAVLDLKGAPTEVLEALAKYAREQLSPSGPALRLDRDLEDSGSPENGN